LLHFDADLKRFSFRPTARWRGLIDRKVFAFTGYYKDEYKARPSALLRKKSKLESGGFDMEPFEVLRDMLRESTFNLVGGAPQLIKAYTYSSCKPYAVFWPSREAATINLLGRPLLNYERSEHLVLDPNTLSTVEHADVANRAIEQAEPPPELAGAAASGR
jgi:hypothetical protein